MTGFGKSINTVALFLGIATVSAGCSQTGTMQSMIDNHTGTGPVLVPEEYGLVEQHLIEVTRKLEAVEAEAATASVGAEPASGRSEKVGAEEGQKVEAAKRDGPDDDALKAALHILGVPLFKVSELPLQHFVLAKMFCESEGAAQLEKGKIEELTRRIKMYDRSEQSRSRTKRTAVSQEERRHQLLIRKALDKCRSHRMGALTLQEIDIIIGCYDMIVQRDEPSSEDARLLDLINRSIDYICTTWSRLETLRESMDARREGRPG